MSATMTLAVVNALLVVAGTGLVLLIAMVGTLALRDVARGNFDEDRQREPSDFFPEDAYESNNRSSSATAASESRLPA